MSHTLATEVATQIAQKVFATGSSPVVQKINPLIGGVSADVFRLDVAFADGSANRIVLRAHREGHSGHPAKLEHQLLKSLYENGLPVPRPLYVDDSGKTFPQPFLVIEFIDGNSEIPPNEQTHYVDQMAAQLAAIHHASTADLPKLPLRLDPLPEVFDYLPEGSPWSELHSHLQTLTGTNYPSPPKLLHGDFWPENLLWQNGRISAVLDWEDAAVGDPLSDVAACRVELRYLLGEAVMNEFTQAYIQHLPAGTTLNTNRLFLWQIYVAAAAQKYMGLWGLEESREAHMRAAALKSIEEAGSILMGATID